MVESLNSEQVTLQASYRVEYSQDPQSGWDPPTCAGTIISVLLTGSVRRHYQNNNRQRLLQTKKTVQFEKRYERRMEKNVKGSGLDAEGSHNVAEEKNQAMGRRSLTGVPRSLAHGDLWLGAWSRERTGTSPKPRFIIYNNTCTYRHNERQHVHTCNSLQSCAWMRGGAFGGNAEW